jgi:hypothetical protein
MSERGTRLVRLLLLVSGACACTTPPAVTEELGEALCQDGRDNDADGLADCQDWKCLGVKACCDMPAVVLEDDFALSECASQECGRNASECAPNPDNWMSWGAPFPLLCEGGLSPHKEQQCFDVGVLSKTAFDLRPGLSITVGIAGRPEPKGFLAVGLTLQDTINGAIDACAPITTVLPIAEVRQVATRAGYRLDARFDERSLAMSPDVNDQDRHEVRLWIEQDHLVHYALDGVELARSPDAVPLPEDLQVRLALSGRSLAAHFADALVVAGGQCETPDRWTPAQRFVALDVGWTWDAQEVFRPFVLRHADGGVVLYYLGCPDRMGTCDVERAGVFLATMRDGFGFHRTDTESPLFYPADYSEGTLQTTPPDLALFDLGNSLRGYLTVSRHNTSVLCTLSSLDGLHWSGPHDSPVVLESGAKGAWDDGGVCCATAVERGSEVYLWYAGQDADDKKWRIGLASSRDGVSFVKSSANPVLVEGGFADYDGHGLSDPEVYWDESRGMFRMWYKAESFGGVTSIAYAISPDGIVWSKYPENPVVRPESLEEVGSPTVLRHNGRLGMWIEAHDSFVGRRIFGFENRGRPFESVDGAP